MCKNIRILNGCEVQIGDFFRRDLLFVFTRPVEWCQTVIPFYVRPDEKMCVVQVIVHTLKFYPPHPKLFFLQICWSHMAWDRFSHEVSQIILFVRQEPAVPERSEPVPDSTEDKDSKQAAKSNDRKSSRDSKSSRRPSHRSRSRSKVNWNMFKKKVWYWEQT